METRRGVITLFGFDGNPLRSREFGQRRDDLRFYDLVVDIAHIEVPLHVFPLLERYFQFYPLYINFRNRRPGNFSRPRESFFQSQMRIVKRNDIPVRARHKYNEEEEEQTEGYLCDAQYIVTPLDAEGATGNLDRAKSAPTC